MSQISICFVQLFIRHNITLLFICPHIFEQHNCVSMCHHIISKQVQQHNILYGILAVYSSSPSPTSVLTSYLTTWFKTLSLFTRLSHFHVMSSTTDRSVYSNHSHSGVTFSDSFNTLNVTVTGGMWEASGLWWKHSSYPNIFIWLPLDCNQTRKVSVSLLTHWQ